MSFRSSHKSQLQERKYNNWVKGGLALKYLKDGIGDFANEVARDAHSQILQTLGLSSGSTCDNCNLKTLKPPHSPPTKVKQCPNGYRNCNCLQNNTSSCPKNICGRIYDEIVKSHGTLQPSWKNTDITKWTTHPWEIAKCFINVPGYDEKQSAADTDVVGLLHLFINCTFFQGRVSCKIDLFDKIRVWRNCVFHSPSMELEDQQLTDGINDIITLLEDNKELKSKECSKRAVLNLKDLQQENFIITTKTETEVCRAALASITQTINDLKLEKHEAKKEIELVKEEAKKEIDFKKVEAFQKVQCATETGNTKLQLEVSELRRRVDKHDLEIYELQTKVKEIESDVANLKEAQYHQTKHLEIIEELLNIKEELITYYRENESQLPASPLVEEHKVALEDLYVIPPMWAYDDPYRFGPGTERRKGQLTSVNNVPKRQSTTVSQILFMGNVRYKKIYITANAGIGKTSLSQRLTMTWCQANRTLESLTENYEDAELDAMKYFDLLFLLHLRDYQSEPMCKLDDLIMQMVTENLPSNTFYTKEVLQRLLRKQKCLIIVDGLDEWAHPDKCGKTPAVPHNNYPDSCTVLTTSRPWKLGTIGLSEHNIDRHIEIGELDVKTREQLEINAVRILNEKGLNLAGKDRADFDKEVKSVQIGEIIYIPYILLQLVCLFFGDIPIGKSKCEIYSNITDFTLKIGLNRKNLSGINLQSNDEAAVPICMKENKTVKLYISLIKKLGKLAFFALFSEKKESSLIFDSKIVSQYLTEQEIDFCLKVGLLCQTKDNSIIAERRYKVYFHHKSVQEFFSAIYITSEWENNTVQSTIFNACSTLACSLEMSNLFVFVCGMNHEVYTCISGELQKIVEGDEVTCRFRSDMYTPWEDSVYVDDRRTMKSYQSLQVQCFQECGRNRNESCSIHLYDIVLDDSLTEDDLTALNKIILFFNSYVKSLYIGSPDEKIGSFIKNLDPGVITSLETLRVERCDKEPVWLTDILTEYARKLKCLTLSGTRNSLSDNSITALTGLTCLQSLYLLDVNITHSNLKSLYAYISQITTLTQLKLCIIYCSDHMDKGNRDCDFTLNLHLLYELKMLYFYWVPCRELHVKPTYLEKFEFVPCRMMTDSACASLLEDLRTAPVLTSLGLSNIPSSQMIQINHTLTQLQHQLQYLKFVWIDMCDVIPRVTPAMTKLERVDLWLVKLSSAAWTELFHSVGQLPQSTTVNLGWITMTSQDWRELLLCVGGMPQVVTVELEKCGGPSREEWGAIVDLIKSTPTLSLLKDLSIGDDGNASLTLKKQ